MYFLPDGLYAFLPEARFYCTFYVRTAEAPCFLIVPTRSQKHKYRKKSWSDNPGKREKAIFDVQHSHKNSFHVPADLFLVDS